MLNAILTGLSIGLGLAVSVGPYFLFLVNTSLVEGKSSASYLAFVENAKGFAGFFILAYGIYTIMKKPSIKTKKAVKLNPKEKLQNVLKGFVFNGLNPSVFVFWFATVGILISKTNFTRGQTLVLFISIVWTTFTCDLIKVRLAEFFSDYFTESVIKKVNRVVGSLLIVGACYLLVKAFVL